MVSLLKLFCEHMNSPQLTVVILNLLWVYCGVFHLCLVQNATGAIQLRRISIHS